MRCRTVFSLLAALMMTATSSGAHALASGVSTTTATPGSTAVCGATTPTTVFETTAGGDPITTAVALADILEPVCPNEATVAAVLGMFYRESQFQSNARAGWTTVLKKCLPEESVPAMRRRVLAEWNAEISAGLADGSTRAEFLHDTANVSGGYGLPQWLGDEYCGGWYDYAAENGYTLGDARGQCLYTVESIAAHRPKLWAYLQTATDPYDAGYQVAKFYEGTTNPEGTASFSLYFYNKLYEVNYD